MNEHFVYIVYVLRKRISTLKYNIGGIEPRDFP